ncbi:MAG: hypothetical protein HKL80_12025 [Acidimicrobiales bacterium]|nr:hypothetical protein [Acidimicrobiales bacterium]
MNNLEIDGSFASIIEIRVNRYSIYEGWNAGVLPLHIGETTFDRETIDENYNERDSRNLSSRVDAALYSAENRYWKQDQGCLLELVSMPVGNKSKWAPSHLLIIHAPFGQPAVISDLKTLINKTTSDCLAIFQNPELGRSFNFIAGLVNNSFWKVRNTGNNEKTDYFDYERSLLAWQLSTLRSDDPPIGELAKLNQGNNLIEPTADITLLINHDGAALVFSDDIINSANPFESWLQGETAEDNSSNVIQWHLHTTLTDCILLGMLQRSGLNSLADQLASLSTGSPDINILLSLQEAFAKFKASIWWHHVSEEETGNLVLHAYQSKHKLEDLFDEVSQDLTLYTSQVQALSSVLSSAAVTILTLTLFPLTFLLGLVSGVTPSSTNIFVKAILYLLCVPLSLGVGFTVAAFIPNYLPFLRSIFKSKHRADSST